MKCLSCCLSNINIATLSFMIVFRCFVFADASILLYSAPIYNYIVFKRFFLILFHVYEHFTCMCVSAHVCASAPWGGKVVSDPLELEL